MDKTLIHTNRKWHQNVMNLLLGKNVCGLCLNLDDDLLEWDNIFVFEQDDLNVESSLKNIMASAFTTTILDIVSTGKFCQKCIDEIIRAFIFIHKIQENCNHIKKIITEISHQMKWTQYLDETGSLSDIKDNLVNSSENKNANAKKEEGSQTEKNNSIDQTKNTRKIFLNDESLKTTLLQDPEMHRFLTKNEENKEIKLSAQITVKKVIERLDMKDIVSHGLLERNSPEDTDYESIIPNIHVSKNKNSSNEIIQDNDIKSNNDLSVKLVNGSNVTHNSGDNMDIVPEDLLELTWPEDDIGNDEHCMKIPVKKLNFNEALTVKFIPSQNTNRCQEMDSEIAPHELLELSWNEDSDVENSSLETKQKHNIDLTKWLQDQGMSTIKPNLFDKGETTEIPQIEKLSEKYNETEDCQYIEGSPMFEEHKETKDVLRCALCCSIFEQFESYRSHYKGHKITEIAKCHRCSSEFSTIDLLLEHLLQIHSENAAFCNFCFAVLSQERLTHHMSSYHKAEVNTISAPRKKAATVLKKSSYCKICKQPFDESASDAHICIESDARCSECKNACIHEKYLSSYRNQLKAKKRIFKCTDCKFKYKNKCDIIKHANRVHLKYRPYRCKVCNIGFSLKVSLGKHQNMYHARCSKCPRGNMCKHNSARCNIKCELCGQKFNYETKYKQHKETALLVTEECFVCQQIVPVKCNMVRHIEYVHNVCLKKDGSESILYECLVCEHEFNSGKEFYTHNWEHKGKINKKFLSTRSRTKKN